MPDKIPKCIITTGSGEHVTVEAHGFKLLAETGFVILNRRDTMKVDGQDRVEERAVAIFYRPDKVLLPVPKPEEDGSGGLVVTG